MIRKCFDLAYEHLCDVIASYQDLVACLVAAFILLTTPLWVIPYVIINRTEEGIDGNEKTAD